MHPSELNFKRKFSVNFRKNLKLELSKMSFSSDFTNMKRGNLYPTLELQDCEESLANGIYTVFGLRLERVFSEFFPYASYDLKVDVKKGKCGLGFVNTTTRVDVFAERSDSCISFQLYENGIANSEKVNIYCRGTVNFVVSARPGFFDLYLVYENAYTKFIASFSADSFKDSAREDFFRNTKSTLVVMGESEIHTLSSYLDCGIAQADIRPVRYESGEVIRESGRMFFTASVRMQAGTYQGVFSWLPGTDEFKMEGALFFDIGDGVWNSEVASCLIYNRCDSKYHLWIRCAAAGHVLAYASFDSDVRFGVNVVDIIPVALLPETEPEESFMGVAGDEDPEFLYDEARGVWMMAVCRVERSSKKYRYFFYESDRPDGNYRFIGKGAPGAETGGSIVPLDGKYYFICGNDFSKVSDYRVYEWGNFDSFSSLSFDYPDGGFRGWGSVFALKIGTRTRYFHFTFDRKLMSDYNWSYGNLYCFEAEEYKK